MQLVFNKVVGSAEIQYDVLKAICGNTEGKTMIDLGAGNAPVTRTLGFELNRFVDIIDRGLGKIPNSLFLKYNLLEYIKRDNIGKVAVSISCDCIEHFWEADGRNIIKWMEENSRKQIIFTPQGRYMNVSDLSDIHPDTHKHSWTDKDFQKMGWATITFPDFHPTLGEGGLGAFFAYKCKDLHEENLRIYKELFSKKWA